MKDASKSPFKFLDAYDKEDKEIFFGREMETEELYDRLFETNLVLLYGASGTGKTSLINCGLSNQFTSADWLPIFIRRQDNLPQSWETAIAQWAQKAQDPSQNLIQKIHSLYLDYFKPVYFIFDQFEELFISGSKAEQMAFFEALATVLKAQRLNCKFIISMREEYLANLSEHEYTIPQLFDNRLRIERMNNKHLREVILGTTRAFEVLFDEAEKIPETIIERLRDRSNEIDLANLQVYLDRLYRMDLERQIQEQADRPVYFDLKLIEKAGDLDDVMSAFLDEQIQILETELREIFNIQQSGTTLDILFTLVTDNGTKQVVEVAEIRSHLQKVKKIRAEVFDYCINRLKDMRILRQLV